MKRRNRKPNRKKEHNYSDDGWYFITTVTKNRENWFGCVIDGKMVLNEYGDILKKCWFDLQNHYKNCVLDEMIIMPNHLHGIIEIDNSKIFNNPVGTGLKPVPTEIKPVHTKTKPVPTETKPVSARGTNITTHGLSEFMRALKTFSSRRINEKSNKQFQWQRSFHDRIIRDETEYINIKNYIINNPLNWNEDKMNTIYNK